MDIERKLFPPTKGGGLVGLSLDGATVVVGAAVIARYTVDKRPRVADRAMNVAIGGAILFLFSFLNQPIGW